tara:strand:+ start:218 stop:403 length:186 start_codon:yes stop_codon:yes gene_type:complete
MKKFIFLTPLALLLSMLSFTSHLEAAGCSSHKNKNVETECSSTDNNCNKLKSDKNLNKVDV